MKKSILVSDTQLRVQPPQSFRMEGGGTSPGPFHSPLDPCNGSQPQSDLSSQYTLKCKPCSGTLAFSESVSGMLSEVPPRPTASDPRDSCAHWYRTFQIEPAPPPASSPRMAKTHLDNNQQTHSAYHSAYIISFNPHALL